MVTLRIRSSFSPRPVAVVFLAAPETKRDEARKNATRRGTMGKSSASIIAAGTISLYPQFEEQYPKMDEKERSRALELALSQIEKQFGKGSILRLGSKDAIVPVSVISTGSISLAAALGVGGFPRGRINEVFGTESSGKTANALEVIAERAKARRIGSFIDVEHALDPAYARKLG